MSDTSDRWEDVANAPLPRSIDEPIGGKDWLLEDPHRRVEPYLPDTELQALMETAPSETPMQSKEELRNTGGWWEKVMAVVDYDLTEEERAVIEVTVIAGHSIRKAAEILGWPKSTVYRIKQSALRVLERELGDG